jgi:predicted alpha/beta hydrolase
MESSAFELEVRIPAPDGFVLRGMLYDPFPTRGAQCAALLCSGGGIPARVYRRFAAWLAAARGLPVLAFDYRGIGRSRPASLRGFDARLEDWAELDCAAAIAWLRARYPGARLVAITHSIGALVLAASPNAGLLERFLLIGAHSGYCGDYHPRWRALMTLFWHRLVPWLAALLGYFPGRRLGLGEDLPGGFARQWGRRRQPAIEVDSPRVAAGLARLRELRGAALALTFTDDGFATPDGAHRMLAQLPELKVEHRVISPGQANLRRIGHFGFFRPHAEATLWRSVGDWLLERA